MARQLIMTDTVRKILRREIAAFLTTMATEHKDKNWPGVPPAELIDALGDAVISMGGTQPLGLAMVQMLIYEVQEKVNQRLARRK